MRRVRTIRHLSSTLGIATLAFLLASCGNSAAPGAVDTATPGNAGPIDCVAQHWVAAWAGVPTDAVTPGDASLSPFAVGPSQTFRDVIAPLGRGQQLRLRLSNRFGQTPVVFDAVTLARRTTGAAIDAGTLKTVQFDGQPGLTLAAGEDATSDPVAFAFEPLDELSISISAVTPGAVPTQHFTARQHAYATAPGAGNQSANADATLFVESTTVRPFLIGLDTLAPAEVSTLVTFGDSLTDGYQAAGQQTVPQSLTTIDLNQRYPDFLARRLSAAGLPIFVANAGISGNRVLADGEIPPFGPSAVSRLDADVLAQAGVSDVIFYEGINDIDQTSDLTVEQLIAGYVEIISRLHAKGLKVTQATLTPNNANTTAQEALRAGANDWIRDHSTADAIVDFDAAVRDATNPSRVATAYDGGDGLHFNAAGYQRLAETIDLHAIRGNACGGH